VTRVILPHLRQQGSGHFIQITSIGGRSAFPGFSGYHAAKFAVEGLSEALALEVKPLGLKVTIVEPGGFRTDWAGVSMAFAKPLEAYSSTVGAMRGYIEAHNGKQPGDPRKAAQAILKLVDMPEAPLRLPLGNDAMAVLRNGYKTSAEKLEHWAEITKSTDFDGLTVSDTGHAVLDVTRRFGSPDAGQSPMPRFLSWAAWWRQHHNRDGFIFQFACFVSPTRLNTQSPIQIPIILDSSGVAGGEGQI
jgi:hypothetical protein